MQAYPSMLQKRAVQKKKNSKTAKNVLIMPCHTKSAHALFC